MTVKVQVKHSSRKSTEYQTINFRTNWSLIYISGMLVQPHAIWVNFDSLGHGSKVRVTGIKCCLSVRCNLKSQLSSIDKEVRGDCELYIFKSFMLLLLTYEPFLAICMAELNLDSSRLLCHNLGLLHLVSASWRKCYKQINQHNLLQSVIQQQELKQKIKQHCGQHSLQQPTNREQFHINSTENLLMVRNKLQTLPTYRWCKIGDWPLWAKNNVIILYGKV